MALDSEDRSIYTDPAVFFHTLSPHMRPTVISIEAARQSASSYRAQIFDAWDELNRIVRTHEATIRKRWIKRTGIKRRELLQSVYPDLPASHAPEVELFSRNSGDWEKLATHRDSLLFPFMNLEDLSVNNGTQCELSKLVHISATTWSR